MSADTESVESREVMEEQAPVESGENEEISESSSSQSVPLSALQKERRKRQEAEQKAKWLEEFHTKKPQSAPEEEEDLNEPATKADLNAWQSKTVRQTLEASWIKDNPEKAEEVNERLQELLKMKPHLAKAIEVCPNRYEEGWILLNALSPKEKAQIKNTPAPKKQAPGSPSALPKAAGINESVDVMQMSDKEYLEWRQSKKRR